MTSVVEVAVPAADLALAETFQRTPGATVESMQAAAADGDAALSVLTVEGGEDVERAVDRDATVEAATALATLDEECVLRVDWTAPTAELLRVLHPNDGAVLEARATDGTWWFRVLFGERAMTEDWHRECRDSALRVNVESVYGPTTTVWSRETGLSEKQYAALESALRRGFYEVPRRVTLEELAAEFDVTHQALSERLSRAHRAAISNVVSGAFFATRVE
ncbi:helix-turn-helix domain-containing protein [Halobacterium sp. NMX12-1]|uniref:Helix-turn-helix domain-containing protein n=1 Tax=Halobacterium sp. NMX12-1 TaxID=3166650 RepID=A0AAU8CAN0_9EURY